MQAKANVSSTNRKQRYTIVPLIRGLTQLRSAYYELYNTRFLQNSEISEPRALYHYISTKFIHLDFCQGQTMVLLKGL